MISKKKHEQYLAPARRENLFLVSTHKPLTSEGQLGSRCFVSVNFEDSIGLNVCSLPQIHRVGETLYL